MTRPIRRSGQSSAASVHRHKHCRQTFPGRIDRQRSQILRHSSKHKRKPLDPRAAPRDAGGAAQASYCDSLASFGKGRQRTAWPKAPKPPFCKCEHSNPNRQGRWRRRPDRTLRPSSDTRGRLGVYPVPLRDEADGLPPGPRAEPSEFDQLRAWAAAEVENAAALAPAAARLGALDRRLLLGSDGLRLRLALVEAAELSWLVGWPAP